MGLEAARGEGEAGAGEEAAAEEVLVVFLEGVVGGKGEEGV